jgi:hypothetical protein
VKIKALIGSSILLGLMSAGAVAQTLPASCGVSVQSATGMRFYVPTGLNGARVNLVGWGNGTGGGATTYSSLLNAAAARCVLVAAATTSSAGDGTAVRNAVNAARTRFANILRTDLRIAISGHSQGGGGAFNAANLLGPAVKFIIAVQPDTVFTTRIQRAVAADVNVTCIFSTGDTLAPASPSNGRNCDAASTIYRQITTSGTHFSPLSTGGGAPGAAMRQRINELLR